MIKIAVFGAGRIGQVHARNAAAHGAVELRYVVDPAGTAAADLAALSGAAAADADTVFADDGIDGVVIASATNTHAGLVERAAAAGKAVLCEKPLSIDFATAVACVETIERSGIRCMVGFQRRYDASYRAVRERIRDGRAGMVFQINAYSRGPAAASMDYLKVSGGLFRDSSIHDFDMARYLTGGEFGSVYAVGACLGDPAIGAIGDIDTAMIVLVARAGPLVQINNCRYAPFGYDQRIEVLASQAFLQVTNAPETLVVTGGSEGFTSAPATPRFIDRYAAAYAAEIDAFVRLIEDGTPPLANHHDGLAAQRLAEAAVRSLAEGVPVAP